MSALGPVRTAFYPDFCQEATRCHISVWPQSYLLFCRFPGQNQLNNKDQRDSDQGH